MEIYCLSVVECSTLQSSTLLDLLQRLWGLSWSDVNFSVKSVIDFSIRCSCLGVETRVKPKRTAMAVFSVKYMQNSKKKTDQLFRSILSSTLYNWCVLTIRLFGYSFRKNGRRRAHPTCKQNQCSRNKRTVALSCLNASYIWRPRAWRRTAAKFPFGPQSSQQHSSSPEKTVAR